jgi:hypothetical protein
MPGRRFIISVCVLAASLGAAPPAVAQAPAPPTNLTAQDHRRADNGTRLDLKWEVSPDDATTVRSYQVMRSIARIGDVQVPLDWQHLDFLPPGTTEYTAGELTRRMQRRDLEKYLDVDGIQALKDNGEHKFTVDFDFQVFSVGEGGVKSEPARLLAPVAPEQQWFDGYRQWFLLTLLVFCGAVVMFISMARRGKPLKVRKIAGLEAVDEAVGRATEMGRSVLFIPGIQDMNDIQTIAGINILARVAKTAAEYDAKVEVPTSRSLVMTTARETVHGAFLAAGRPDAYNEDLIYYVTDEQFGFVAYLQGMMVREKPAACFYMGSFYAESLILAETGNAIGAIQVAGTAQPAQLPFFVAACDYTLIGEEFFAASAYLTGTPEELGSLKGQDVGKMIVAVGIVFGVAGLTLGHMLGADNALGGFLLEQVAFFKDVMLT